MAFPRDEARWPTGDAARQPVERASSAGSYRLTNIPAGAYFIAALNATMLREWPTAALLRRLTVKAFPVEVAAGESVTLNLWVAITGGDSGIVRAARVSVMSIPLGTPSPPGVVVPTGTAIIAGRVVDANNQAVPRLQVRAIRALQREGVTTIATFGQPAMTDADGTFRVENLRAGTYLVAALAHVITAPTPGSVGPSSRYQLPVTSAPGLAYVTTLYPGVTSASQARAIELSDGARATADFALQQRPATTLTGALSKGEGRVQLTLVPVAPLDQIGGVGTQATATSDDGAFRFTAVSAGKYTVVGSSSALGWVQAEVTVDTNQREPIVLELRPPLTVSGSVRFDGAPPILTGPNVQPFVITLLGTGGPGASGSGVPIRASGEFAVRVAPGSYRLLLNAPARWQIASAVASGVDLMARPFAVTGDMSGIDVLLREVDR